MGKLSAFDRALATIDQQIADLQRAKDVMLAVRQEKPKAKAPRKLADRQKTVHQQIEQV